MLSLSFLSTANRQKEIIQVIYAPAVYHFPTHEANEILSGIRGANSEMPLLNSLE